MSAVINKIKKQNKSIRKELLNEIVTEARKIMTKHPVFIEFIMAMGTCFFVDKYGNNVSLTEEVYKNYSYSWKLSRSYFKKLQSIFEEFDEIYKLSGEPMRFTAVGEITTDW